MVTIGVVGSSGAGKTALVERLIPILAAAGIRVGYLKHAHAGYAPDVPDTDSWRARRAGAAFVGVTDGGSFLIHGPGPTDVESVLAPMVGCDLVLVEGCTDATWPKVVVRNESLPDREASEPILAEIAAGPGRRFREEDLGRLARTLVRSVPEQRGPLVRLVADGRSVPLGEFSASLLASALLGMVSALKDVGDPADVTLHVHRVTDDVQATPQREGREEA
ncbi:MAG: molybdopterin-guanine dinucleotide biosynthesis protein B [Actinobacteria bacterium]|nr:molybdopterin-guanine dinucleotide biosynthesis protein B [Actinomycetota bacterium]